MIQYLNNKAYPYLLITSFCCALQNYKAQASYGFCYFKKMAALLTEHLEQNPELEYNILIGGLLWDLGTVQSIKGAVS